MAVTDVTSPAGSLRILHVMRAPVGGLFRHVQDLVGVQIARGHDVGLVVDSTTGGERGEASLAALAPKLALGLLRLPMRRPPHVSDVARSWQIARHERRVAPDIVHGHGSKGGLFARMPGLFGASHPARAYTPHGGSLNQDMSLLRGRLYMQVERLLMHSTDVFLFESAFIGARFHARVAIPRGLERIVRNGIGAEEFIPIVPAEDAADFVYVGELRAAKGIDTLLDALALLKQRDGKLRKLVLVGSGPDETLLRAHAARLGLGADVSFPGTMAARQAFTLGRVLVVPSRAESLPYIVLEAAGAQIPMIATNVGGIPEIFGPHGKRLIGCDDPARLAARLAEVSAQAPDLRAREAEELAGFVASRFSIDDMADTVIAGYREALARLRREHAGRPSLALPT